MTTVSGAGSTLTQQLYQKLFDRLNVNGDDAVSLDEMGAVNAPGADASKVFAALDADGDGRIVKAEMTPSDAFGAETLGALIDAQTDPESSSGEAFLADWFARTDTDGDGLLTLAERQAEADLRRAAIYDAGYTPTGQILFASNGQEGDGFSLDQLKLMDLKPLKIELSDLRFAPDLPPERLEQFNAVRERMNLPPLAGPLTEEERQSRLEQLEADRAERASGPEGTRRFLSRELDGLRAGEGAHIAETALSDAMAARMFRQIIDGWNVPTSAGVETTA